jgi:hypothetical protein
VIAGLHAQEERLKQLKDTMCCCFVQYPSSRIGSALHVRLFPVCLIYMLCIFNDLCSGIRLRALLGYHYLSLRGMAPSHVTCNQISNARDPLLAIPLVALVLTWSGPERMRWLPHDVSGDYPQRRSRVCDGS